MNRRMPNGTYGGVGGGGGVKPPPPHWGGGERGNLSPFDENGRGRVGGSWRRRRGDAGKPGGSWNTVPAPESFRRISPAGTARGRLRTSTGGERPYGKDALVGAFLAIAATDDPEVNRQVLADAAEMGILAQRTDEPREGDFSFPATLRRGNFTVSFATDGISPALSAHLRAEAVCRYGEGYGEFLRLVESVKEKRVWKEIPRERRRQLRWNCRIGIC